MESMKKPSRSCNQLQLLAKESAFLRINYYPPCPRPDLALGVVVLVPNEVQGLQVFRGHHWYDVKYIPNALMIHIGDQIQILSNGIYKAVLHRTTVNKDKTRMPWSVFLEPPAEHEVGPIPKLVSDQNPARYKTKKDQDYVYDVNRYAEYLSAGRSTGNLC